MSDEELSILEEFKGKVRQVKSVRFETDAKKVLLVPLGDVHFGHPTCDVDKFKATIDFIRETDCRVILMGDLLECANKNSVGAGWVEQLQSPQDQLDIIAGLLHPIRKKVDLLLTGNHELRAWKDTGFDPSNILANYLKVPYGGYAAFAYYRVGKQNYVVYAQHGSSGARYTHTKLQAAMRTASHTEADIYLYGHTHALVAQSEEKRFYDKRLKGIRIRKQYTILTGGFLSYEGSYAQMKNYNPTRMGVANVSMYAKHWDVHCST